MPSSPTPPQDRFRTLAMDMAMAGGAEEEILTARDLQFHHRDVFPFTRVLGIIAIAAGVLAFLIGVRFFGTVALICGVLLLAGVDPREKM